LSPRTVQEEVQTHIETTTEPHFTAPIGIHRHKPLFVFLPGLDGTGMYISSQLEGLRPHYDVRCLCIPTNDRSTYEELAQITADFIAQERMARGSGAGGCSGGAPVTVCGESFGGPVALCLGSYHPDAVQMLVVVNSGSGLRRHPLLFYGSYLIPMVPNDLYNVSAYCITPFLSELRRLEKENQHLMMPPMSVEIVPQDTVYHRVRLMADFAMKDSDIASITADTLCIASVRDRLLPSLSESRRLASLIDKCQVHLIPEASHTVLLEKDTKLVKILAAKNLLPPEEGYPITAPFMPKGTEALTSREQAKLAAGAARDAVASAEAAKKTAQKALEAAKAVRAKGGDMVAFEEASSAVSRLVALRGQRATAAGVTDSATMQSMMKASAEGKAAVQAAVAEKQAIREKEKEEAAAKAKKKRALMQKFKGNTLEEMTGASSGAAVDRMMEEIPQMRMWNWLTRPEFFGLENIPEDERPLLFVGNHTIYGLFDMPLMIYEVRKRTGYTLRGLAHPLHYMSAFGDLLARYGAVKATPRNCFKLLQAGQAVLLYPGGAREVAKRKGEKYKLLWKEDAEFVRLAMRFKCTIVPFASVGTEDAFNIAMDSEDIMASPLGPSIQAMLDGAGLGKDSEYPVNPLDVIPPIASGVGGIPFLPSPQRLYFKFSEPIRTDHFTKEDMNNTEVCQELYMNVKGSVESTIEELQEKRDNDPLSSLIPRTIMSSFELWDGT